MMSGPALRLLPAESAVLSWYLNPWSSLMPYDGKQVADFLSHTHDTSHLTEREKHLVGLAVTLTRGCPVCTRGRIEKARAAGVGDDVLNALAAVASAVNAGVTAATARESFRLADASPADECNALCSAEPSAKR